MQRNPKLRAVLQDRPEVVELARKVGTISASSRPARSSKLTMPTSFSSSFLPFSLSYFFPAAHWIQLRNQTSRSVTKRPSNTRAARFLHAPTPKRSGIRLLYACHPVSTPSFLLSTHPSPLAYPALSPPPLFLPFLPACLPRSPACADTTGATRTRSGSSKTSLHPCIPLPA